MIAEVVPRGDLVQAIALGGIGFNIARAFGPALAGFMVVLGGAGLAFALNALSFLAVIGAWCPGSGGAAPVRCRANISCRRCAPA